MNIMSKDKIIGLVKRNIDYSIREIGEKSSAAFIENIMNSIIINKDYSEEKKEREFLDTIKLILSADPRKNSRIFGVKINEVKEIFEKVFLYDRKIGRYKNKEIINMCFEDKLRYFGYYRFWLKAYKDKSVNLANKKQAGENKSSSLSDENIKKLQRIKDLLDKSI